MANVFKHVNQFLEAAGRACDPSRKRGTKRFFKLFSLLSFFLNALYRLIILWKFSTCKMRLMSIRRVIYSTYVAVTLGYFNVSSAKMRIRRASRPSTRKCLPVLGSSQYVRQCKKSASRPVWCQVAVQPLESVGMCWLIWPLSSLWLFVLWFYLVRGWCRTYLLNPGSHLVGPATFPFHCSFLFPLE